jgi:hypothetical protein
VKVADASPAQKRDAERKFAEGQKLFEKGKFDEAMARFRASHDRVADPKASLMIATALRNTGDLLTARAEYKKARAEAEHAVKTDESYGSTLTKIRENSWSMHRRGLKSPSTASPRQSPSSSSRCSWRLAR